MLIGKLKDSKDAILGADQKEKLHDAVEKLDYLLEQLEGKECGDLLNAVKTAREKVRLFWLGDTTRFEVCRWVQTIICQMKS